ncbi:MAG: cytochrome P450 [Solirubrobacterales bacterium]
MAYGILKRTFKPPLEAERPEPLPTGPAGVILGDFIDDRRTRRRFPPGAKNPSARRTLALTRYPLPMLLELYRKYGPVFSFRLLHRLEVAMIGPAANHFITVSHADLFTWRLGHLGELTPLIGDGILTTDGAYHDRNRRLMMPAFHRRQIDAAVEVMVEEVENGMRGWKPGAVIDLYAWFRGLALRMSMRSLLGMHPDDHDSGAAAALHFEAALAFWGTDVPARLLRGPGTPWARMKAARAALDEIVHAEIQARRRRPEEGGLDVMSMLLAAREEDGSGLTDEEIRDQLVTLMFAGHDTSTSTISFLAYELARNPLEMRRLQAEQDEVLGSAAPDGEALHGALPRLEMTIDEAMRLHPPVWIGARRAIEDFEFEGRHVAAGSYVNYFPWASHRLPKVFEKPDSFIPARMSRERKAELPKGAFVPFGGGSRICIGKRFGQAMVATAASRLVSRFKFELPREYEMRFKLEPTLSPRDGLPLILRERRNGANA